MSPDSVGWFMLACLVVFVVTVAVSIGRALERRAQARQADEQAARWLENHAAGVLEGPGEGLPRTRHLRSVG